MYILCTLNATSALPYILVMMIICVSLLQIYFSYKKVMFFWLFSSVFVVKGSHSLSHCIVAWLIVAFYYFSSANFRYNIHNVWKITCFIFSYFIAGTKEEPHFVSTACLWLKGRKNRPNQACRFSFWILLLINFFAQWNAQYFDGMFSKDQTLEWTC